MDMNFKGRSGKEVIYLFPVRYDQESKILNSFRKPGYYYQFNAYPIVIKGLNIRMDIELLKTVKCHILMKKTEIYCEVMVAGNIQVTRFEETNTFDKGNYEISAGQYLFTLMNFVNKPFRIKKGGTIIWTGDPLNADITLEASYDGFYYSSDRRIYPSVTQRFRAGRAKEPNLTCQCYLERFVVTTRY